MAPTYFVGLPGSSTPTAIAAPHFALFCFARQGRVAPSVVTDEGARRCRHDDIDQKRLPVPQPVLDDDPILLRKAALRAAALARRDDIPAPARADAAEAIASRPLPVAIGPGTVVSGFMPIRSEISPLPLMRRCAAAGAQLALPAIAGRGRPLVMRAWSFGEPLVRGQWGIREPAADARPLAPDVLLVPLAAFDRRGRRIGYGAGYYDMTLAQLRATKPVVAIGVGFAAQEVEEVPTLAHDQSLDFVLTEREFIDCRDS